MDKKEVGVIAKNRLAALGLVFLISGWLAALIKIFTLRMGKMPGILESLPVYLALIFFIIGLYVSTRSLLLKQGSRIFSFLTMVLSLVSLGFAIFADVF